MSDNSGKKTSTIIKKRSFLKRWYFLRAIFKSNIFWCSLFFTGIFLGYVFLKEKIPKLHINRFCIKKVEFDGNEQVPEIILLKASGLKYKSSILSQSIIDVKKRLENISWIHSVEVQRKLPDKIYIRVSERTPIAILQSKHKLYLVDSEGIVIEHDGIGNFSNLPIVAGAGAEKEANQFLDCLDKFPKIKKQLIFAIRIGKRRWNIKINKGITVKLPEKMVIQALGILEEIADNNGFFQEDIISIDLRIPDRIIVSKRNNPLEGKIKQ